MGRVMSGGVYLILHAYVERDEDKLLGMAGEKFSSARPFVGVVWDYFDTLRGIPLGIRQLLCLRVCLRDLGWREGPRLKEARAMEN